MSGFYGRPIRDQRLSCIITGIKNINFNFLHCIIVLIGHIIYDFFFELTDSMKEDADYQSIAKTVV